MALPADEQTGGVGTIGEATYFWTYDDGWVSVGFDTGETMYFEDGQEGWASFLAYCIVLGRLY